MTGAGRRARASAWLACALAAAALLSSPACRRHTARTEARRLFGDAERLAAALDIDSEAAVLRQAWRTDSSYVPAIAEAALEVVSDWRDTAVAATIDSFARRSSDTALARCVRRLATWVTHRPLDRPDFTPPTGEVTPLKLCAAYEQIGWAPHVSPPGATRARLEWLHAAVPESYRVARRLLERLVRERDWDAADSLAAAMIADRRHPMSRVYGYAFRPVLLHLRGREADAEALDRAGRAFAERTGPGALSAWLGYGAVAHYQLLDLADSALAAHGRATLQRNFAEAKRVESASAQTRLQGRYATAKELLDGGRLRESLAAWDSLLPDVRATGREGWVADLLARRGRTLVKLGRLREGERSLLESRTIAARSGDMLAAVEAEHNLLHLYDALGDEPRMLEAGTRFLELSERSYQETMHFMANHDLAWHFQRAGETNRARAYFAALVAQVGDLEDFAYWGGEYFEFTGELDSARAWYARDRGVSVSSMARRFAALSRVFEALGYRDSATVYARLHDAPFLGAIYPEWLPLLPGVLARAGRPRDAERAYAAALEVAAGHGQLAAWAEIAVQLAAVRLDLGEPPAPLVALADSAARAAHAAAAGETGIRARAVAGAARVAAGDVEGGFARLRAAARDADHAGLPALSAEVHERLARSLGAGRSAEALDEFARAARRLDSLARSLAADPLRSAFRGAAGHVSNGAFETLLAARGDRAAARRFLEWSLRRKSLGIVETSPGHAAGSPSLESLTARLPADAAVLDYVVLDSAVGVLVLTRGGARVIRLPVGAATLEATAGAMLASLVPRLGTAIDTARARLDVAAAHRLYEALLAPLLPALGGRTRLLVVPDGPLSGVPFDALVTTPAGRGPDAGPQYVLDRFTISLLPTLALMDGSPGTPSEEGAAVLVAGPGPDGTDVSVEVTAVAGALGSGAEGGGGGRRPIVLRGADATEAAVTALAAHAALLHIAAHARPNDANPAFARLALAPGGGADGALHAYEIEQLRLPGTLVTLSACETAAGRIAGGEGALSLSRAFLRAGASGTVATLWPVGPASAPLMETFYRALARGDDPATALRVAKLAQRHGAWPNPLHWAAFTLVTRRP